MLSYALARIAAVLEVPPTKPTKHPMKSWHQYRLELIAYRAQLERWRRIGEVAPDVAYREVANGPATPGAGHGPGTLQAAQLGARDVNIVHTEPNRAMRRRAGARRVAALRIGVERSLAAREARAAFAAAAAATE